MTILLLSRNVRMVGSQKPTSCEHLGMLSLEKIRHEDERK